VSRFAEADQAVTAANPPAQCTLCRILADPDVPKADRDELRQLLAIRSAPHMSRVLKEALDVTLGKSAINSHTANHG
jgi:hypothetical protein